MGVGFVAVPFISSWKPSARAQTAGAPVEVDISKIEPEPGMRMIVQWRGKPVWIFKRTPEAAGRAEVARRPPARPELGERRPDTRPSPRTSSARSSRELAVIVGICTHLGCAPSYVPELQPQPFDREWQGGFFCPCHNSRFDLAGRVFTGHSRAVNLGCRRTTSIDDNRLVVGVHPRRPPDGQQVLP